jgi:hypothetical protein
LKLFPSKLTSGLNEKEEFSLKVKIKFANCVLLFGSENVVVKSTFEKIFDSIKLLAIFSSNLKSFPDLPGKF